MGGGRKGGRQGQTGNGSCEWSSRMLIWAVRVAVSFCVVLYGGGGGDVGNGGKGGAREGGTGSKQ